MLEDAAFCRLKPAEFWHLTPREYYHYTNGVKAELEYTREIMAWHAACIMNASGTLRRPVTGKMLLEGGGGAEKGATEADFNHILESFYGA